MRPFHTHNVHSIGIVHTSSACIEHENISECRLVYCTQVFITSGKKSIKRLKPIPNVSNRAVSIVCYFSILLVVQRSTRDSLAVVRGEYVQYRMHEGAKQPSPTEKSSTVTRYVLQNDSAHDLVQPPHRLTHS